MWLEKILRLSRNGIWLPLLKIAVWPRLNRDCLSGALCPVESVVVPKSPAIMTALEQGTFTNSKLPESFRDGGKITNNRTMTGSNKYLGCINPDSTVIDVGYINMIMKRL